MKHLMKLTQSPFERTKSGKKVIEGRLFDEKRQLLNVGDELIFQNRDTKEEILSKIIKLEKYNTFGEMYDGTSLEDWDWSGTKEEFVDSCYTIYSKEDEQKYATLAIYFKLV